MLFCIAAFVFLNSGLPLTEPPPEASSSVAREAGSQGMNVKAREAARQGMALTG